MKLLLFNQELYPINYLRNIAISYVSTPFIFQLDVDFLPQFGLHENLMNNINRLNINESDKIALIVPAFETERYRYFHHHNEINYFMSENRLSSSPSLFLSSVIDLHSLLIRENCWNFSNAVFCIRFATMFGHKDTLRQIIAFGEIVWNLMKCV